MKAVVSINIFVFSDESGVLDKKHDDYFVFGGVIFLSADEKDNWIRRYIGAENNIRKAENLPCSTEIKASNISNTSKRKLYSLVSKAERFGTVISQKKLKDPLFDQKKSKQRYLDWVFKMAVKIKLQALIRSGSINPAEVANLYFYVDEHTTATNGRYELQESLEQEFKYGTFNWDYNVYHKPLFPDIKGVSVQYCNSAKKPLVRAADIVANRLYYLARTNAGVIPIEDKLTIYYHP